MYLLMFWEAGLHGQYSELSISLLYGTKCYLGWLFWLRQLLENEHMSRTSVAAPATLL